MRYTDDRWNRHNEAIDKLPESWDDLSRLNYFRRFVTWPLRKNTQVMRAEIEELLSHLEIVGSSVLEVGAGFGNFCKCLHDKVNLESYTILDTTHMLRFSRSFLQHHKVPCQFVPVENYRSLFRKQFGLFISNICISETPEDYRNDLIDNVWPNCKKVFMIDGEKQPNFSFNKWLETAIRKHFKKVTIKEIPYEICNQKHQKVFVGEI